MRRYFQIRSAGRPAGTVSATVLSSSAFGQEAAESASAAIPLLVNPTNTLLLAVAGGGLVAGAVGLIAAMRARKGQVRREAELEAEADAAREAQDNAEAFLAAEPHILFLWRGAADTSPAMSGAFPADFDLPTDAETRLDFASWLDRSDARQLSAALTELKITGTPFNIFVRTQSGERLAVDGFPVAGKAALKLKPLHGDSLDFVEDRERMERIDLELGSIKAGLAISLQPAWIRDAQGRLVWVNAAYAKALGAETPAAAVASQMELANPAMREKSLAATRAGDVSRNRLHLGKSAKRRSFEVVEVPAPLGSAGIATDVSQIDALRDELDRHISAHGQTLDRLTTAVAIFDPDQRLKFFNSAYSALWGLDPTWLRQEPSDSEILDHLQAQGRLEQRADYRGWRKSRLAAYKGTEPLEDQWHLPDGRSLRVVAEPHPYGGLTYLYEDVTERLALEARYNGLLSVQRETLDNLHEGVALFGTDGRLKLFNPGFAAIWQLDADELSSEPHMDAVISACRPLTGPAEHWDELRYSVTASGAARQPTAGRLHRTDGTVVDHASVPLPDGATLLTYVDATDGWRIEQALRERNEALLAADDLKTAFLSHISYELRAPLTSIMGFSEFLAAGTIGPLNERQSEYVGLIQNASEDLRDLINDVIDLATIDAGAMELDVESLDVNALVREAVSSRVEKQSRSSGIALAFDLDPEISGFMGDANRLKQVLYHLMSNAIGFSSEGDTVTLGTRLGKGEVLIFVSDQGRGIDSKVRDRIFERFETYTEGTAHRGTGLGLTIVKGLVELHRGAVEIISEPGKGTTVNCRLPLAPSTRPRTTADKTSGLKVSPALDQNAPPTVSQH